MHEIPPDLYTFSSWHFRRAYRKSFLADEIWNKLCSVAGIPELEHHKDNPSRVDVPIHAKVREIFSLPEYKDHSPFWEPTPQFVGETLSDFLKFYYKAHQDSFVATAAEGFGEVNTIDNKPEDVIGNDFDTGINSNTAYPAAPSGDLSNEAHIGKNDKPDKPSEMPPVKRGPGRPRKQLVTA